MDARQKLREEGPGEEGPIYKPRLSPRMKGEWEGALERDVGGGWHWPL